jgi:hypothetical protein
MFNLGKITSGIGFVGETVTDKAGSLYGGAQKAFSERMPTPKAIGGPLIDVGLGIAFPQLLLGKKIHETVSSEPFKEKAAETIVGGLDPVFGEGAPLDISEPARSGDYGGALGQLGTNITRPIVQTGQALTLPLLAVAGILLLK